MMRDGGLRKAVIVAGAMASLALGGCAQAQTAPEPAAAAAPVDAAPLDPAERAAQLLVEADEASLGGDIDTLARRVARIERMGLQAAEGASADEAAMIDGWHDQVTAAGAGRPPMRGRVKGPAYRTGWLEPGQSVTVEQLFLAGEGASIGLSVRGAPHLDVSVQEPDGASVCQKKAARTGSCQWLPLYTRHYRIRLSNSHDAKARYWLVTN